MDANRARMLAMISVSLLTSLTYGQLAFGQRDARDSDGGPATFEPCRAVNDEALFKPIGEIRMAVSHDGKRLPPDCSQQFTSTVPGDQTRFHAGAEYQWKPTNFFHRPAYFDDVPLERYGQTSHELLQPALSGSKFVLSLAALPYRMGIDPPFSCVSTLGHRPPGDCVPCIRQVPPLQGNAAIIEAAAAIGWVLLIP